VETRWYRAPEVILTAGAYGAPIDIWAAGCILAEMLAGRPLFAGKDAADQLDRVHRLLGSPTPEALQRIEGRPSAVRAMEFPRRCAQPWEAAVRNATPEVIGLLQWLLAYVPGDRPTAAAALQHPVFHAMGLRPPLNPPAVVPRRTAQGKTAGIVVPVKAGIGGAKGMRRGIGSPPRGIGGQQPGRGIGPLKLKMTIGPTSAVKMRL
jgi:serine/threonine protein kinase